MQFKPSWLLSQYSSSDDVDGIEAARPWVQEMMILAGEAVGEFGADAGVPLPYRGTAVQADPGLKARPVSKFDC